MAGIVEKMRLIIADIKWHCRQFFQLPICAPTSPFSIESYKPSFVAKFTPEEMEEIRWKDKIELIEELEEIIHSKK